MFKLEQPDSVSIASRQFVVLLPLADHLFLPDKLCLEVDMAGVGWDMVEGFGNTSAVRVVQAGRVAVVVVWQEL